MSAGGIRAEAGGGAGPVPLRACAIACVSPALVVWEILRDAATSWERKSRRRRVTADDMRKSNGDEGRFALGFGVGAAGAAGMVDAGAGGAGMLLKAPLGSDSFHLLYALGSNSVVLGLR